MLSASLIKTFLSLSRSGWGEAVCGCEPCTYHQFETDGLGRCFGLARKDLIYSLIWLTATYWTLNVRNVTRGERNQEDSDIMVLAIK